MASDLDTERYRRNIAAAFRAGAYVFLKKGGTDDPEIVDAADAYADTHVRLLPPVAPAGDREAVARFPVPLPIEQAHCQETYIVCRQGMLGSHTVATMDAFGAWRLGLMGRDKLHFEPTHFWPMDWLRVPAQAALSRARTGSEARDA